MRKLTTDQRWHTLRLMSVFLAIIMSMTILFSLAVYGAASEQLHRQVPPNELFDKDAYSRPDRVQDYLEARTSAARYELATNLVVLNLFVLVFGAALSYMLARRMLEPIETAMQAQTRFVSDASHELRTPLAAIQIANEVALRKKSLTNREARLLLENNLADVHRLQQLTSRLLALANHEAQLTSESVDLQTLVSQAMTDVAPAAMKHDIAVDDTTERIDVLVDAGAIVEVLTVLLDNAIKYSPDGSTVTISSAPPRHGRVKVSVRDEGAGIEPDDLPHIFDRLYRADDARSQTTEASYGLGLPIAKQIIELHGGVIEVQSTLGSGTTFTISLPAPKPPKTKKTTPPIKQ